jgi:hypothetical protein
MILRAVRNARQRAASVRRSFYRTITVVTIIGLAFAAVLVIGLLKPLSEQLSAHDWVQVPCTIILSTQPSGFSTYSTLFDYSYGGASYSSNRANFYARAKNMRFAAGSALTGWIDPDHPERFVQDRNYAPPWYVFLLLIACATIPAIAVLHLMHGMATLSPTMLRYLGEKPDDAPAPG